MDINSFCEIFVSADMCRLPGGHHHRTRNAELHPLDAEATAKAEAESARAAAKEAKSKQPQGDGATNEWLSGLVPGDSSPPQRIKKGGKRGKH